MTAAEKRWHKQIAKYVEKYGVLNGGFNFNVQHHHVVGRTYIHNKVKIGKWFVIPLPFHLHDVSSDNVNNVTHFPKNFVRNYGKQCGLWNAMRQQIMANDWGELPFSDEVVASIMDTNK